MWIGAFFAVFGLVMFGGYWFIFGFDHQQAAKTGQFEAYAQNMVVFHQAAASFANTNFTTTTPSNVLFTVAIAGSLDQKSAPTDLGPAPGGAALLQSWYVPAAAWQVAWGRDPDNAGARGIVATYLPPANNNSPVSTENINLSDLAESLGDITGGYQYAGIVTNGRVSSALGSSTNTNVFPSVPVTSPPIPNGSAIIMTPIQ